MTDQPETPPVSPYQGPAAAASANGSQSHRADESLAGEVLRESTLTLAEIERISGQLDTAIVYLTVILALSLLSLSILSYSFKKGGAP